MRGAREMEEEKRKKRKLIARALLEMSHAFIYNHNFFLLSFISIFTLLGFFSRRALLLLATSFIIHFRFQ